MTNRLLIVLLAAFALAATACASGPSEAATQPPPQTTTTEPLPEGIVQVKIVNASFRPSVLNLDLDSQTTVRWLNEDDFEYELISRDRDDNGDRLFESGPLGKGGQFEFDFSTLDPAVYRYFITRGAQTIPGLVDTRPAQ